MPKNLDYLNDPDATPMPWLTSPFARRLIDASSLSEFEKFQCRRFERDGYLVIDLELSDDLIQSTIIDMEKHEGDEYVEHFYDKDKDHKRFFDLWRESQNVCDVARHGKLLDTLNLLYRRKAIPFQTINFKAASEQAAHSDSIHFASIPARWVVGVVVLLEEAHENNGPFFLYPGTHKLPAYELNDTGLYSNNMGRAKEIYTAYEKFIDAMIIAQKLKRRELLNKTGTAIIFDANILHG